MRRVAPSHLVLLFFVLVVFAWSGWQPHDRFTWWLEIFPGLAGLIVLAATYRRFRFTTLCYTLIALHICLLCVGGHYTYARVPLFDWLRRFRLASQSLRSARSFRARLRAGHDRARSFHPAQCDSNRRGWMPFLVVCVCLAISAFYELIEWWTALVSGDAAQRFPRHARRCLGHAGRHAHGVDRRDLRARFPATAARSTTLRDGRKIVKIDKYISVFNIGLQNTFVYRWNYFLRALFGLIPLAGTVFFGAPFSTNAAADCTATTTAR